MLSNPSFRRAVTILLILAGMLAPLRTVFSCQLMEGRKQYACCCHGQEDKCRHGGCAHEPGEKAGCCDISHEIAAESLASPGGHAVWVLLLEAPQLPVAPVPLVEPAAVQILIRNFRSSPPVWFAGTHTYLETQRLRI